MIPKKTGQDTEKQKPDTEKQRIDILQHENNILIKKCIELEHYKFNATKEIDCYKRIVRSQADKFDLFKHLFWRIYFKCGK